MSRDDVLITSKLRSLFRPVLSAATAAVSIAQLR
jgi:hypothetical protein